MRYLVPREDGIRRGAGIGAGPRERCAGRLVGLARGEDDRRGEEEREGRAASRDGARGLNEGRREATEGR